MSPMDLLDRVTRGRGELAVRYSMVSVFGVVFTQLELIIAVGLLDLDPTKSNIVAVMICAVPVFLLNKRWVWNVDGKVSLRREIIPFWIFTGAGLALSTLFVVIAGNLTNDSTIVVMFASLSGFGVLWVAKFLFLDQIMFGHSEKEEVLSQEQHPAV
jgi:putative flippase GtrA